MDVRIKFTLDAGTTSATLFVDNVPVTASVMADRFPCPLAADAGLDCLDISMPAVEDPAHRYVVMMREDSGHETMIGLPADAQAGSRWHPLMAPGLFGVLVIAVLAMRAVHSTRKGTT